MDYVKDNEKYRGFLKEASAATNINYYKHPSIGEQSLRIDTEMAMAMTTGYVKEKEKEKLKTSIISSHPNSIALRNICRSSECVVCPDSDIELDRNLRCFEVLPKLITHNAIRNTRGNTPVSGIRDRPLSLYGLDIKKEILHCVKMGREPLEFKYIASLVAKYHIKNTIEAWTKICNSGIFDIWDPKAPYYNIKGRDDPLILLLRVYELKEAFSRISSSSDRYHEVAGDMIREIKEPVIEDSKFLKIHENLDSNLIDCNSLKSKELYIHKFIEKNDNTTPCVQIIYVNNFQKLC